MTNSKKANGLFLTMTVCIICFYLFGKGLVTGLPVSIRLISSEIVYLIPVLLCLLIGRDSIGKLIPHRAPRISTLLMTILFVLLLEPLMTCLNVFTMLFSTNYVLETRSDLSIISVPLILRKTGRAPGRKRFRRSFSSALSSVWALWYGEIFGHNLGR